MIKLAFLKKRLYVNLSGTVYTDENYVIAQPNSPVIVTNVTPNPDFSLAFHFLLVGGRAGVAYSFSGDNDIFAYLS